MRIKSDPQGQLELGASHLKVTEQYYQKYHAIDQILRANPEILDVFHQEAAKELKQGARRRRAPFTSEQLLRSILVMEIEQLPYRDTVVRIDDSVFLRRFVGIPCGAVMDFTTLSRVYKRIRPQTWKKINAVLGQYAVEQKSVTGNRLRVDTTAYETNVHYPTDSSLLWDGYRVVGRLMAEIRRYAPEAVGGRRLQTRTVKRLAQVIARRANQKATQRNKLTKPYKALLAQVCGLVDWSREVRGECRRRIGSGEYDLERVRVLSRLLAELEGRTELVCRVIDQTRRRVFNGETVPPEEKVLSLFEPHTELLIRGKAGKPIEFGHMVLLNQVENKFISDYEVFEKRPTDESLVDEILSRHVQQFGQLPESFAADKGFYESMEKIAALERDIEHVSIAKKGRRNQTEIEREHHPIFRELQRFRAGIEGTISFLKRCLKMSRCLYRSFATYCSSVGSHILAHNLLVLARL